MEIRKRSDTRRDEGKGDNQCEQGRGQTERDGNGAGYDDDDDKNRVQTTNDEPDDVNDSQALTGGDVTKYREPVARISFLSQDRPDLKFVPMLMLCDGESTGG